MPDNAHLAFALALHRVATPDPSDNACWSPFSVASALGLTAAGAYGPTRDELLTLLLGDAGGDLTALAETLGAAATLSPARDREDEPVLAVSNTLWADVAISIRDSFTAELSRWANGSVRNAPFRAEPDKARDQINADVAETTRNLIPELLPPDAIRPETVAALVNALYLKCAWRHRFTEGATEPRPFHTPGGAVDVPTMQLSERIGYAATGGWQVLTLPAVGDVEAVVLLPDGDLATVESTLDGATLANLLAAPAPTQVNLLLPKVDVRMQVELTPALHRLGVHRVFRDDADLSGISEDDALAVQAILHESVLKLDEQGLEGAAATAVMMRLTSMPLGSPVDVAVDRPFLLLVRHAATGVLYFVARVVDP